MTKVIASATDTNKKYFLTIENGNAVQCSCPDRIHRAYKPCCKHMIAFNQEVQRAATFLQLKATIEAVERERQYTNYLNWQLAMGL